MNFKLNREHPVAAIFVVFVALSRSSSSIPAEIDTARWSKDLHSLFIVDYYKGRF